MSDRTRLSPRAGIALLSLQLRSTVQEAIEAEAAADAIDVDGALWQLRSRLTPLIDERRRALDDEVAAERERGVEAIAAAHLEADRIVAAAVEAAAARAMAERAAAELARRAAAAQSLWEPLAGTAPAPEVEALAEPVPEADVEALVEVVPAADVEALVEVVPATEVEALVDVLPAAEPENLAEPETLAEAEAPAEAEALVEDALPVQFDQAESWAPALVVTVPKPLLPPLPPQLLLSPPALLERPLLTPPSAPGTLVLPAVGDHSAGDASVGASSIDRSGSQPIHVVLDADSFARAFAAAMAPILEARQQAAPQYLYPPAAYLPVQATPSKKKSFWANAWHPDVLLSGLAMVIVIIVLIAWTG